MHRGSLQLCWKSLVGLCVLIGGQSLLTSRGLAQEKEKKNESPKQTPKVNPLKPADTSTPRATLKSFLDNMDKAFRLILEKEKDAKERKANHKDNQDDTKKTPETPEEKAKKKERDARDFRLSVFERRALSCLDLSKIDPEVVIGVGRERGILLSEILHRIALPDLKKEFPNEAEFKEGKLTRYRVPDTQIIIERVEKGPRKGEFLISAETVKRLPKFFALVKEFDYKREPVYPNAFENLTGTEVVVRQEDTPLLPADTTSPQTTLKSFLDSMSVVYETLKEKHRTPEVMTKRSQAWARALRCLDLSKIPPKLLQQVGTEKTVLLMEVLYRTDLPPSEQVPSLNDMEKAKQTNWTIPGTEIIIARIEKGPRGKEYLFTTGTVERVDEFYDRVKHLPYKTEPVLEDAYHVYRHEPGPWISVEFVRGLPSWLRTTYFDQPLWKWLALAVVLIVMVLVLSLAFRLGWNKRPNQESVSFWWRAIFPICGIVLPLLAGQIVTSQLRLSGPVLSVLNVVFILIVYISAGWLVFQVGNAIANTIVHSPTIKEKSINAHMVRTGFRILSFILLMFVILWASADLGIPLTPVLAGLGVGGVAIALAAQNTVENLIGGFNLFFDRPVKVGDFCRFGDKVGTVEEIGLRSTRIRTLDDTVISVPNATFSKQELENFSTRQKIWYHPQIPLRVETTPDQVRFILVEVNKLLHAHPMVLPEPVRIRFTGFGEGCMFLDVFAYVKTSDFPEFLEVQEDLNLRILEVITQAGTGLALEAEVKFMEGLDPERTKDTEQKVEQWRKANALYLPRIPEEKIAELRGSLEYPPEGSPKENAGKSDETNWSEKENLKKSSKRRKKTTK